MIWRGPIRLTLLATGVVALGWVSYILPIFASDAPIQGLARQIAAREGFQSTSISNLDTSASNTLGPKWRHPSVLASKAIIELRLLEQGMALSETNRIDQRFAAVETGIQRSLTVVPADPFLWTVYFWVENNRLGFRSRHLDYLRMSYETGPSEGWVAVTRARFTLAVFRVLPPDMASAAVAEFSRLVGSRFYLAAIDLLSRQGESLTSRLLASLTSVEFDERQMFARAAYKQGYDWEVPGIDRPEWRPWH